MHNIIAIPVLPLIINPLFFIITILSISTFSSHADTPPFQNDLQVHPQFSEAFKGSAFDLKTGSLLYTEHHQYLNLFKHTVEYRELNAYVITKRPSNDTDETCPIGRKKYPA